MTASPSPTVATCDDFLVWAMAADESPINTTAPAAIRLRLEIDIASSPCGFPAGAGPARVCANIAQVKNTDCRPGVVKLVRFRARAAPAPARFLELGARPNYSSK